MQVNDLKSAEHRPAPVVYRLSNGMRVAYRQTTGNVSYIGVAVNAGSRDESSECEGLAHFVEHTIFKGTTRRKSWQISSRMESIGGELNAYTSKEETLIYTNAPAGDPSRAIELLADIIKNSIFPSAEIERERDVVIEEINSYLDSPADAVFDEFEELIYAGSPLAHNILGTPESVRTLRSEDCLRFIAGYYTPDNMVIYAVDTMPAERILRQLERHFGGLHQSRISTRRLITDYSLSDETFDIERERDGHQAHTVMGCRTFGRRDPRRHALFLLNNYLGGPCMSSRLNREIRERRGLAYTVESNVALLSDCGTLTIYFGCDPEMTAQCVKIVNREIERLASKRLTERTFAGIREQYCGQLLVASDHRESAAMSMAKSLMYYDEIHDATGIARHVREVTAEQMREVAEMIASKPLNRLTLR